MKTLDRREPLVNRSFARAARDIGPIRTTASIDTIELFFRKAPAGLRTRLEAALGRRIEIKQCVDATGYTQGFRAVVNRPNLSALKVAGILSGANSSGGVFRIDIAADCDTSSELSSKILARFLARHLVLKWRSPTAEMQEVGSTVYWANGSRTRNVCVYYKRPLTIRIELRFLCSRSVSRAKLAHLDRLAQLNPRQILAHNLKLVAFTENYIQKAIRRAVCKDRHQHLQRRANASVPRSSNLQGFADRYRAGIAPRVEHILRHLDMQAALSRCRAMRSVVDSVCINEFLCIPDFLSWPNDDA